MAAVRAAGAGCRPGPREPAPQRGADRLLRHPRHPGAERDDNANTIKLAVQVPPGFLDISTEYMPGWTAKVLTAKLAKPVHTSDGTVTEQVREVIWTGDGKQGKIPPGQFLNFPISTVIPGKEGEELTFKVLQYYDNGEVVRWIGPPKLRQPAPADRRHRTGRGAPGRRRQGDGARRAPRRPRRAAGRRAPARGDSASKGLGIAALIVGALGLLAGGAALLRSRPRAEGGKAA